MRSIRRSLTLYLFSLLAITLGVMWVVIDLVMTRALAARETAGADLIKARYEAQCKEERKETDEALFRQARELGTLLRGRLPAEMANHRRLYGLAQLMFLTNPLAEVAGAGTIANYGSLLRQYFATLPLPDEDLQHNDEDHGNDYRQINTIAGKEWHSRSLAGQKLPFDANEIETKPVDPGKPTDSANLIDWVSSDTHLGPGNESVRRVLYRIPIAFRGPPRTSGSTRDGTGPMGSGTPPRSLDGAGATSVASLPRWYIQCARPHTTIEAGMARFAAERDEALDQLSTEIRDVRTTLRVSIGIVGLCAFLAIAIGGPLIVGTGLRPVGKLSDAVSRVSEHDFKLSHDGADLVLELAPIHAGLTQTLDMLQRAFTREKQAVADISHELRTPIAALMATIDVALRKTRTTEQYRTTLEECRLISKQLGQLVERIMTLASLDAGNERTLISRTDAVELATGCAAMIRPLAAANGITVHVQAEDPLELDTDPGKLREVLMNLLHNAVEYNSPNGLIDLTVRQEASTVAFEVRDTGIGMTAEVKEKIFERFFRADPSRHATGVHAGLGLAIVKEYVDRLHGTIAVESQPGVGTTFRLTLPTFDPPHPPHQ